VEVGISSCKIWPRSYWFFKHKTPFIGSFTENCRIMNRWILSLCTLLTVVQLFAQSAPQNLLEQDIYFLASDELQGREIGTDGEKMAAQYIAERMSKLGLTPKGTEEFFQNFSVTPKANPHSMNANAEGKPIEGINVIGQIDKGKETTVIIGAHFDHLGMGAEGSLHSGEAAIHNGADDNASGVALMLQIAEKLANTNRPLNNNYVFIAFSGEEKGLWGSNHFVKNPTLDLSKVNYMINFDMVGRLDEDKGLAINGVGTSPMWKEIIKSANKKEMKLILGESGVGPSDHTSFYLQDIPVLHFFTGQHEDYHKPEDDFDRINFEGIGLIKFFVLELMATVDMRAAKLEFTKTKEEQNQTPRFTVTLGVMPDYMFQGEGMRIDGVMEDRPAKKAGFEKGDVVIQMGEHKVEDMMGYMKALSKFQKGDKTKVKVKRGEEVVEEEVVF